MSMSKAFNYYKSMFLLKKRNLLWASASAVQHRCLHISRQNNANVKQSNVIFFIEL